MTLSQKVLLLISLCIVFVLLFSFFFLHFLYKDLYITSVKESVIYQGERTAAHYHYGSLSDEIIEKIQWYNIVSEYEVIVVDDLEELSTYFPYKLNYEALVNEEDKELLQQGSYVIKDGYVEELNREIVGAVFPILAEKKLIGFIYIYVPLADLQEVFQGSIPILILVGSLFFIVLFIAVNRIHHSLFQPLTDIQKLALEVSNGNYSYRLNFLHDDEIGKLANAFNRMSSSLEEQEVRKKDFLSNVVHELRTPLTYIGGYTQVLKEQIFSSPEEAQHYLLTIEKETGRLIKLIHDLVDLDHLQENMYLLNKEPIAMAQLLFDTLDLFKIHMNEKNIQLKMDIQEDVIGNGDPKRIQQIFYNLLDNAIKYSHEYGIISVILTEEKEILRFKITNQGTEISTKDLQHVGERFFRTDKARSRSTGGTGLGLSIVKEIVRLHDGLFSIESDSRLGTSVVIVLPVLTSS